MGLPVNPPVPPMLARASRVLPAGDFLYEPKWDGFRCITFRDGDEVFIGSRNERPLTRYFPDVVGAVREAAFEHLEGGSRLRHTARWRSWRPERDPRSCTFDQLEVPVPVLLSEVF